MFWVVRWSQDGEDKSAVVEAASRASAECWALKRDIPLVIVSEAEPEDVRAARAAKRIWTYTVERGFRAFGRSLSGFHVACLMITGMLTAAVNVARAMSQHGPGLIGRHFW
jgi:hypothetical protein